MEQPDHISILGGVLAGGLSRRMEGNEKSLMELDGQTLIKRVVDRLALQVRDVVINANGDRTRFAPLENTVVPDLIGGHAGPLAGIHALIEYAINSHVSCTHIATVAGDTPFFPVTFVDECRNEIAADRDDNTIVIAKSGGYRHPVFGLWPVSVFDSLSSFLQRSDTRKVMAFVDLHPCRYVEFALNTDKEPADPFFNINSPLDMEEACAIISRTGTRHND